MLLVVISILKGSSVNCTHFCDITVLIAGKMSLLCCTFCTDQISVIIIYITFAVFTGQLDSIEKNRIHLIIEEQIDINGFITLYCSCIIICRTKHAADKLPLLNILVKREIVPLYTAVLIKDCCPQSERFVRNTCALCPSAERIDIAL